MPDTISDDKRKVCDILLTLCIVLYQAPIFTLKAFSKAEKNFIQNSYGDERSKNLQVMKYLATGAGSLLVDNLVFYVRSAIEIMQTKNMLVKDVGMNIYFRTICAEIKSIV